MGQSVNLNVHGFRIQHWADPCQDGSVLYLRAHRFYLWCAAKDRATEKGFMELEISAKWRRQFLRAVAPQEPMGPEANNPQPPGGVAVYHRWQERVIPEPCTCQLSAVSSRLSVSWVSFSERISDICRVGHVGLSSELGMYLACPRSALDSLTNALDTAILEGQSESFDSPQHGPIRPFIACLATSPACSEHS